MNFSFSGLNLNGIKASTAVSVLPAGRYVCKVTGAEVIDTKDQTGKRLVVKLREINDKGVITDYINVHNKSEKATEIGLSQLKGLLENGGHPDPDNIGSHGVKSIEGLVVGVVVGKDRSDASRTEVKGYYPQADHKDDGTGGGAPKAPIGSGSSGLPF